MIFDYLRTIQAMDTISIDDIGNTCINAINDDALEWFLIIETVEGWTKVTEFGPLHVDSDDLTLSFSYTFYNKEFSDKNIAKTIDKFINNPRYMATQVEEIDKSIARERFESIVKSL